jgi:hypothetical protein
MVIKFSCEKAFTTRGTGEENPKREYRKPKQKQPNNPNLEKIQNPNQNRNCLET